MTALLIRRTAKEMAGAWWDENKRSEQFRRSWPDPKLYIEIAWMEFVEDARKTLAGMLGRNDVSEHVKREIYDALSDDYERRTAHMRPAGVQ